MKIKDKKAYKAQFKPGNVVRNREGNIVRVTDADMLYDSIYNKYEPVKINEDILVTMLGFERIDFDMDTDGREGYYYRLSLHAKTKECELSLISLTETFSRVSLFPYEKAVTFKYVHDIQNLYEVLMRKPLINNAK